MECQTPGPARMSEKVAFGLSERQRATEKEAMACCGFCINYGCTHPYTHGHRTLSLSRSLAHLLSRSLLFSLPEIRKTDFREEASHFVHCLSAQRTHPLETITTSCSAWYKICIG